MKAEPVTKVRAAWVAGFALFAVWAAHGAGWQIPFSSAIPPENQPAPAVPTMPAPPEPVAQPPEAPKTEAVAQPLADWKVQPGGRLGFSAVWTGTPITGHFGVWQSAIRFTPDAPEKTTIRISVDLASVNTGDGQRDESLKGPDFFDTEAHPKAVFTASGIRALGQDRFEAHGTLDLHGARRPVTLAFTLKIRDDVARVSGATGLDRTAFGVGSGEWAVTDQIAAKVGIAFDFVAKRKGSPKPL